MTAIFWTALCVAAALLLCDYAYRQFASRRIRRIIENVPTFAAIPAPQSADVPTIRIRTDDGLLLSACLYQPDREPLGLILFCPELHGNRWTAMHYCGALVEAGLAVLAFDFRNQGGSDHASEYHPIHWVTEHELADIAAVLRHVSNDRLLKHLPIGIFGVSRGGSAALLAACRFPQIQAVVTDSGFSTMAMIRHFMQKFSRFVVPDWFFRRLPKWHVELVLRQALNRSERKAGRRYVHLESESDNFRSPALLISGSRDSYVTPVVTQQVADLTGLNDAIWIVEKARHNKSRLRAQNEYDRRIVRHFLTHLARSAVAQQSDQDPCHARSARVA